MSGTTTYESYPYPGLADFADVQDAYRLASAIDSDIRAEQAPFRQFMARPSFIGTQTANSSTITSGTQILTMNSIEWDNTGGVSPGATVWSQPTSQQPSWWMFGATILVNTPTTPVVGDLNLGKIAVQTTDQVTGLFTLKYYYQRNDDSSTSGEWINMFVVAAIYQGVTQCQLTVDGSTAKGIKAQSRFWGLYLGPVT